MSLAGTLRLKLLVAYKGTRFHGWQIQERKTGAVLRTVQGCLEQAVGRIAQTPVRVHGAGRTDAGVHAEGQVAHVDVPEQLAGISWVRALNSLLPSDLAVLQAEPAPLGFHARFSAKSKIYTYSLWLSRRYVLPQRRHYVWALDPLDIAAMDEAAAVLVGEHDFACFRNQGSETETTVRTMRAIGRVPSGPPREPDPGRQVWPEMAWSFHADGFLKQMARNIMGCLVAVGRSKMTARDVETLLAGGDRTLAPATAPPQGLTLRQVFY